jgi:hypothetical protein
MKKFKLGDWVEPRPEWIGDPNEVPSGRVYAVAPWGTDGAFYVGDDARAFASHVFQPGRRHRHNRREVE